MLVHSNNVDRTHQKLLQITLKTHNEQDARLHFHTNVNIAALMLLTTRD